MVLRVPHSKLLPRRLARSKGFKPQHQRFAYRSAGNPYDLPYSPFPIAGVQDPNGLKDLTWYKTSDGEALYIRKDPKSSYG